MLKMRRLAVLVALVLLVLPVVYAQCATQTRDLVTFPTAPNRNSPPIGPNSCDSVDFKALTVGYEYRFASPIFVEDIQSFALDINYCEVADFGVVLEDGTTIIVRGQDFFTGNFGPSGGSPFNRAFPVSMSDLISEGKLSEGQQVKALIFRVSASGAYRFMGLQVNSLSITLDDCTTGEFGSDASFCDVSCAFPFCGDSVVNGVNEQCDGGGSCNAECRTTGTGAGECGDGLCDAANGENPITCPQDCQASPDLDVSGGLFNLALAHNVLFAKVLDILHIVKDALFQLEIKIIEIQLTNEPCNQQPVSFKLTAEFSPYGKLNEIDAIIRLLIQAMRDAIDGGNNFGTIGTTEINNAEGLEVLGEQHVGLGNFARALECKCQAYKTLIGVVDTTTGCCGNNIQETGEECDDGNLIDNDACANDCTSN